MTFPLGKPILAMLIIAMITGIGVLSRKSQPRADLVMWTFADSHADSYRGDRFTPREQSLVGRFEKLTGKSVEIKLVNGNGQRVRLSAIFDRPDVDATQPDVVEIEIGAVGRYLRPPIDEIGLLPLNAFLDRDHWHERIVASRLAPWTKEGVVFGFPHDVHPVSIIYRKDLFDEAGIDLPGAKTWPQFHEMCERFQNYWRERGQPLRHAMELPTSSSDYLMVMLQQRHINVLDDRNVIHLANPIVADTILIYARMVAGNRAIAVPATPGGNLWANDFVNGDLCAMIAPDWRAGFLKLYGAGASGKAAMMPLPRFDPDDAPTASWGGTMAAIPRRCSDPEAAFKLITFLYSDPKGGEARWRSTMILPAFKELWKEPAYHEPDPYFGGQRVGELYIDLAEQLPERYVTNFTALASAQLSAVLSRAIAAVNEGADDATLRPQVQTWLEEAAKDLERRIEFGKFE